MRVRKDTTFKLADNLLEILAIRELRNNCKFFFTNDTSHIGLFRQIYWYFTYYKKASKNNIYRVYLLSNNGIPVGYGALHSKDGQLYITECVAQQYRGQRFGSTILRNLLNIAKEENMQVVAEILATNKASIALHNKFGFNLTEGGIKKYVH
jgi:RimJ/RimL family protein N-acetyltransferase